MGDEKEGRENKALFVVHLSYQKKKKIFLRKLRRFSLVLARTGQLAYFVSKKIGCHYVLKKATAPTIDQGLS
mgnify:CR=1 FL=1